jgi:precorrin-6B methylase 1
MKRAIDYCNIHPEIKQNIFLSDSASALSNTPKTTPHSCQAFSIFFNRFAAEFLENESHQITLQWIPRHQGFQLNERADRLAKKGCYRPQMILVESLSYHTEKRSKTTHALKRAKARLQFATSLNLSAFPPSSLLATFSISFLLNL